MAGADAFIFILRPLPGLLKRCKTIEDPTFLTFAASAGGIATSAAPMLLVESDSGLSAFSALAASSSANF